MDHAMQRTGGSSSVSPFFRFFFFLSSFLGGWAMNERGKKGEIIRKRRVMGEKGDVC
jgi:hypothetical protein